MRDIVIRAGSATENVTPTRRGELDELAVLLRADDRHVSIEEHERIPGRYGVIWAETVAIYIGYSAGAALIAAIVTDVYNVAKSWARDQFKKKTEAHPGGRVRTQSFTLFGPDEKPILYWKISYDGEEEKIYRQIKDLPSGEPEHNQGQG